MGMLLLLIIPMDLLYEIDDNHVRDIPFPLLKDKAAQDKINQMALEANQKRYEAYLAEQEALRIMNDEVIFTN